VQADRLTRETEDLRLQIWIGTDPPDTPEVEVPECRFGHGPMFHGGKQWVCRECARQASAEYDEAHREERREAAEARRRARGAEPMTTERRRAIRTEYPEDAVELAEEMIADGVTLEVASLKVGIPRSTLGYRLRKRAAA